MQALVALTIVSVGLGSYGNLMRDLRTLQLTEENPPYVLGRSAPSLERNLAADRSPFDALTYEQYQMLLDDFSQVLDVSVLLYADAALERTVDGRTEYAGLRVYIANAFFLRHYLGVSDEQAADAVVATPAAWRFIEEGYRYGRERAADPGLNRFIQAANRSVTTLIQPAQIPQTLILNSALEYAVVGETTNVLIAEKSILSVPIEADAAVFIALESLDVQRLSAMQWGSSSFAIVPKAGVDFNHIAHEVLLRLGEMGNDDYPLYFKTAAESYLTRRNYVWDATMEAGILALVLVVLVVLSLSGWCLALYRRRRAQYAACLCVGATSRCILLELALELLLPLVLAGALAYPLGNLLLFRSIMARSYAFAVLPWVAAVTIGVGALICAIALILPAVQLRQLSLPSVLRET